jgi:cytidine deaminase
MTAAFPDHEQCQQLLAAARQVRERAYAPYSKFLVGAALLTREGQIITGINIENASYGLTICAERVAAFRAISEGHRAFALLAVVVDTETLTPPCGACRQVLWELAGDIPVVLGNLSATTTSFRMKELLPFPFDARFLEDAANP